MLSSLMHHKLTTVLLVLQVTLTCGIGCNVVFMVMQRIDAVTRDTGLVEDGLSVVHVRDTDKTEDGLAQRSADLAVLRAVPGVESAVAVEQDLPFQGSSSSRTTCASRAGVDTASRNMSSDNTDCMEPNIYGGGPGEIRVLGLRLVEGRDFLPDEYVDDRPYSQANPTAVILTRILAERMFPGQDALGHDVYFGDGKPLRVVGVVDKLVRPRLRSPDEDYLSLLLPTNPGSYWASYALRSAPTDQDRVLRAATAALMKLDPDRVLGETHTFAEIRHDYFQGDVTMIGLLVASLCGLLFVTALGIGGLAGFWVQQRARQIGIRRAIGASRGDILRHFQIENFLIVGAGVVLGLALAIGLNLMLMRYYGLARLPLGYLPAGAAALWLLGQLAVLSPASHASRIPPASAARNV
ncbi:MAG TPA: FtsX-like permease family protein [Gammaproteobacteria bacterium]